jgi:hypothetical protein
MSSSFLQKKKKKKEHGNSQFHETNTTGHKITDKSQHNIVDDFNSPLSPIGRSFRQKINQQEPGTGGSHL